VFELRPKTQVDDATKQKVIAAASELSYTVTPVPVERLHTIGFYTEYGPINLGEEFTRVIFDGLQSGCGELDEDLLLLHPPAGNPAEISQFLADSKTDGILHQPSFGDDALAIALQQSSKPLVRIGEPFPGTPSVVAEDYNGAIRMAYHLYLRGHRKVLFRLGPQGLVSARRRHEGFLDATKRLNMEVITTYSRSRGDELSEEEQRLLLHFRAEGITAVACWRDHSAAQVLIYCRRHRIHTPEDLAVAGFDGLTPEFCPADLRLTTFVLDWQKIVTTAVGHLIDILDGSNTLGEIIVPGCIYVGNTT
jgi:DNA-binding LacI/PurR family transcriptional regulator